MNMRINLRAPFAGKVAAKALDMISIAFVI